MIYEVFPPLCLGIPQRLQCVVAPPPLPRSPSPSSFCLGVWECLLFPGGVREKVDKLWVGRFPVLSSHVPSMTGGRARNDDHWFLRLPTRARFWRSEGGWEGFASNLPLCLPCPPHSLLPKPPPTGRGSVFSIQEPKGERKLSFQTHPMCQALCQAILQVISIPSWKAFEIGILTAEDKVRQAKLDVVRHRVQDHGLRQQTDLGPNPSSRLHELSDWGKIFIPQSFSFPIPKGRV